MSNTIDQALKLYVVLSRASKVVAESANRTIDKHGLNPTEFAVLELLHHRGKQPIQKIGNKILLRSGSMTYVVDKLEKKGLLTRVLNEDDKRITYMAITPAGKNLIDSIFPEHAENIESIMSGLTFEEQETAIRLLRKLGLSIKNLS